MNLIIDIGNTAAKLLVYEGEEVVAEVRSSNHSLEGVDALFGRFGKDIARGIVSSVVDLDESVQAALDALPCPLLRFDADTPLPITNLYETPRTLGSDRLAAVVGANGRMPGKDVLVVDLGTCITYDFVDRDGRYHGGNISPGMQMRFKALHDFTARLPLVESKGRQVEMGVDTETAIRAGVMNGIRYEVEGYVERMKHKYPELFVFLTGGDEFIFDSRTKSYIFADRFLVMEGLNRILEYNNDKL